MTTLLRRELGDVLRERRRAQGRTLREVSATAAVSLGYLSEVERGEKEASSAVNPARVLMTPAAQASTSGAPWSRSSSRYSKCAGVRR